MGAWRLSAVRCLEVVRISEVKMYAVNENWLFGMTRWAHSTCRSLRGAYYCNDIYMYIRLVFVIIFY